MKLVLQFPPGATAGEMSTVVSAALRERERIRQERAWRKERERTQLKQVIPTETSG